MTKKKPPSETKLKALRILKRRPLRPREFAEKMWPDAQAWQRTSNVGRGATKGVGIIRAGGGYLGKLEKQGLAQWVHRSQYDNSYVITDKGRKLLDEHT